MKHHVVTFLTVFVASLCLLGVLLCGLLAVWNTRHTMFGDAMAVTFSVEEGRPVMTAAGQPVVVMSPSVRRGVYAALPAPLRALVWLWRGELEGSARLFDRQKLSTD